MKLEDLNKIIIKEVNDEEDFKYAKEIIETLIDIDMVQDEAIKAKGLEILSKVTDLAINYEEKIEKSLTEKIDKITL